MKRVSDKLYRTMVKFSKAFSRKNLYEYMEQAIREHCTRESVIINIGAGGVVKEVLARNGLKFTEIDIDKDRKPDLVIDVENMDAFDDNSVDVFFCVEVLEHVKNPFNAVREIRRVLKPDGIIVGSTPFVFPMHDEPGDFYRYTVYALRHLFSGFKCIRLVERNSYIESAYVILLRLFITKDLRQRRLAMCMFPLFLLLLPFTMFFSSVITDRRSTTGYFFIYQK